MAAKDNATLVQAHYDVINTHQSDPAWFDKIAPTIAEDFQGINPRGVIRRGSEGLKTHYGQWIIGFPDCVVEVTNFFATKDQAVVEFIGRGIHAGVLEGPTRDIQPAGRNAEVRFCEVFRFRNRKIVSIHTYYDALELMQQLSVNP